MAYSYQVKVYADGTLKKCVRSFGFETWGELNRGMKGEKQPYIITIIPDKCLTKDVERETWSKLLKREIDADAFDIIRSRNVFWIESRHASDRAFNLAIKETKRIFPCLTCLYDIPGPGVKGA